MPGRRRHHKGISPSATGTSSPLEKQVQHQIKLAAEALGFEVQDMSQPRASMMPRGLPDLYLRHRAKQFRAFVEIKRPGGKVSSAQAAWIMWERDCGGIAFVADSVERFIHQLHEHGFPVSINGVLP